MDLPVSFSDKVRLPQGKAGGYPSQLSATDLDKNFAMAALDVEPSWVQDTTINGHPSRLLALPALPGGGTFVLACVEGSLVWFATEACS